MQTAAAATGPADPGSLPEWDLRDLYPGRDSPELRADLEKAAAEAKAFRLRFQGKLAALDGAALGGAVAGYETIQEVLGRVMSYAQLVHAGNMTDPDEIGFDEGADGTINQWYSIYKKAFPAGSFQLKQADNAGQNMYGAVVTVQAPVAAAVLGISRDGSNVVITFPAGYRLQRSSSLGTTASWPDVTGSSPLTVPAGTGTEFYRGVSP